MEKSLFTCPICAAPLERGERAYACPNGHAYDKAREGYVHLLPANKKHSKAPGDDKGMAEARRRFLSGEYYGHLLAALRALGAEYAPPGRSTRRNSSRARGEKQLSTSPTEASARGRW